jgi:amino acid adenylation domain-containing protein
VSSYQERLWVMQRLEPGNSAYNVARIWKGPSGAAQATILAAIRSLLHRHEILRSSFDEIDGKLSSFPLPVQAVVVEVRDLSAFGPTEQWQRITGDMHAEVRGAFELTTDAPTRFVVYGLGEGAAAILLIAHRIAVDDCSLALLERELATACVGGTSLPQAPAQLLYADYAAWQRASTDPGTISAELDWWERYLAQAPQLSLFPADRAAAGISVAAGSGATHVVRWDAELAAAMRALAKKEGATLCMTMLAACATVLSWYTGQDECVVGNPMETREPPELAAMIGPFVNLLPVRVDLKGDPTFTELLRRSRDSMLAAHEHRHVPFEALLERLKPSRNAAHSPLFQVALVHDTSGGEAGETARDTGGAMHELTWYVRETQAGLECSFEYRADRFSAVAVERIARHLETALRRAAEDSSRSLSELTLLSPLELAQIHQFNQTKIELPRTVLVAQFEAVAARQPDKVALAHDSTELTYHQLNCRANQLCSALREKGVTRGVRVGLCVDRSPALLIALLAIQKAGGTYVPMDPGFPAERLQLMLLDSGATVLLTSGDVVAHIDIPNHVSVMDVRALPAPEGHSENPPLLARPEDTAYVIYTSGSTGRPKGVAVSHGSLMNLLCSMAREPGMSANDILAAITTVSFDIAGLELYLPLLVGGRIELVSAETGSDGPRLAKFLRERSVSVLQATPATWRLLVEGDWKGAPGFRSWCGGEALPPDLAESLLPRVSELWNLYGPTETTIWSSAERIQKASDITIGRPIANTQIYIIGKKGTLQPVGVPGEIWIGGVGVALGYFARPELTAERFVVDCFGDDPSLRLYRTGDLGCWRADGRIEHLGRLDQQVKIRGFRIEVGEVEATLTTLEAVRQAVVVACNAGPSDRRLVAYVVYQPGCDLTVSEVRRHLRAKLPEYMVPSLVVAMDAIPLTPNGKIDRAALPDPFGNAAASVAHYEPPTTEMELLLAGIWAELLKTERVGRNDNFFDLGGHSLLSLQVAKAVAARSGWNMDPRALFFQTLEQIAATGTSAPGRARRRA